MLIFPLIYLAIDILTSNHTFSRDFWLFNSFQVPTLPSFWNKANNAAWCLHIGASSGETFSV